MKRRFVFKFLLFVLLSGAIFEIALRVIGRTNAGGAFSVLGVELPPTRLDYEAIQETVDNFDSFVIGSGIDYDPYSGYAPIPSWRGEGDASIRIINGAGIRAPALDHEYTLEPAPGVLRIALLGDSQVFDTEVVYADSWGAQLELALNNMGVPAEVMNFGVPGFSPSQTIERWQHLAKTYHPDVVLFSGNSFSISLAATLYKGFDGQEAEEVFTLPLYALDANDQLILVNSPPVPPAEVVEFLRNFATNPLRQFERHYVDDPLYNSRLYALMNRMFNNTDAFAYEGTDAQAYIAEMNYLAESVEETQATYIYANAITNLALRWSSNDLVPWAGVLKNLQANHPFIDLRPAFPVISDEDFVNGHYTASANVRQAAIYADRIVEICQDQGRCGRIDFTSAPG